MNCITKMGLAVLLALFLFSSCKKHKDQISLTPEDPIEVFYTDTLSINSSVVLMNDTIRTDRASGTSNKFIFAGSYIDSAFGNVYAAGYTQLENRDDSTDLTSLPLDSIVSVKLNLETSYIAGDIGQPTTINVYTLADSITTNGSYYSTSEIKPQTLVGKIAIPPYTLSETGVNNLSLDLDKNYAKTILENSGRNKSAGFHKALYGLAFISDSSKNASILQIDLDDATSINISYLKKVDTIIKTNVYTVYMTNATSFYRFIGKRTNTLLASLKNPYDTISTTLTNNLGFVQAGIGIDTKILIPYFQNFKAKAGNIIINKAELVLSTPYLAPGLVAAPELRVVPLNTVGTFYTSGFLNPAIQDNANANGIKIDVPFSYPDFGYRFILTNYLQGLINGTSPNTPLLITPSDIINTFKLNRVIFSNPRLKITYTKVD